MIVTFKNLTYKRLATLKFVKTERKSMKQPKFSEASNPNNILWNNFYINKAGETCKMKFYHYLIMILSYFVSKGLFSLYNLQFSYKDKDGSMKGNKAAYMLIALMLPILNSSFIWVILYIINRTYTYLTKDLMNETNFAYRNVISLLFYKAYLYGYMKCQRIYLKDDESSKTEDILLPKIAVAFVLSQIEATTIWEIFNLKKIKDWMNLNYFNASIKKRKTVFMTQAELNTTLGKPKLSPEKFFSKLHSVAIAIWLNYYVCPFASILISGYLFIKFKLGIFFFDKYFDLKN